MNHPKESPKRKLPYAEALQTIECEPTKESPFGCRPAEIAEELNKLGAAVGRLDSAVSDVLYRLQPAMTEANPCCGAENEQQCGTEIGRTIQNERSRIDAATELLHDMMRRLEL